MSKIRIDTTGVVELKGKVTTIKSQAGSAQSHISQARSGIDINTAASENVSYRINRLYSRIQSQQAKLRQYDSTLAKATEMFMSSDKLVANLAKDVNYLLDEIIAAPYVPTKNSININSETLSIVDLLCLFSNGSHEYNDTLWKLLKGSAYFTFLFRLSDGVSNDEANSFAQSIPSLNNEETGSESQKDLMPNALKVESGLLKALAKFLKSARLKEFDNGKSNDVGLIASVLSYITGLYTFYTSDCKSPSDFVNSGLKLTKSSASMWSGLYKYYDTALNSVSPLQASRLGKKFQKTSGIVSLVGSLCGFSAEAVNTFDLFMSGDAESSEKVEQLLTNTGSGLDVAKSIATLKWGQKTLTRTVTAKYQWAASAANSAKFAKASNIIAVASVAVDTGKGFASRYGKVTADGTFDMGDIGEVGISGSVRGLTSIVNTATFGVSDALGLSDKADEFTDGIINFADTVAVDYAVSHKFSSDYIKNTGWMVDYANDESKNVFKRIGVSAVAGTGMIGAIVVDATADAFSVIGNNLSYIGNGIAQGWNSLWRN